MAEVKEQERGCIAFFSTYRPPAPLHIYSSPIPLTAGGEVSMVDEEGQSYNYNGRTIPPASLKSILRNTKTKTKATEAGVDAGLVSGLLFVSERLEGLETLYVAFRIRDNIMSPTSQVVVEVFSFGELFASFDGVRMEDIGCFVGDYFVYVSTMEPANQRRQPWTAVYKTDLRTMKTERLTPSETADLSPSVSPSGKKIAVASFEKKPNGWQGEIEDLKTDILVFDLDKPSDRPLVVSDGGWPTWGDENVIFFHRKTLDADKKDSHWGVFQADVSKWPVSNPTRVTPVDIDAMTPAAIDATTVAVATIREKSQFGHDRNIPQYRHIEIFDLKSKDEPMQITQKINPRMDHYNPFVVVDSKSTLLRVGYHRCYDLNIMKGQDFKSELQVVKSPDPKIGVFRATGVFPSFSQCGTKLAFVDNGFTNVFVAEIKGAVKSVYQVESGKEVFSPIWDKSPDKNTIYVCVGKAFDAEMECEIWAINNVLGDEVPYETVQLTIGGYNNAFPSTNPQGNRLVFRSTRDHMKDTYRYKNLYILEDTKGGEKAGGKVTRLTDGKWTDTHCEWSPNGKWIVYASTQDKPGNAPPSDNNLDPGYFAVFLLNPDEPGTKPVRVIGSGPDLVGHVNHPFFSPDGASIVVVSDLAAVSTEPICLPLFLHSVRPYGDIFIVDIDLDDIQKNENMKNYKRITHSRFENSTASWANVNINQMQELWEFLSFSYEDLAPRCPFLQSNGGQGFPLCGHLCVPNRVC